MLHAPDTLLQSRNLPGFHSKVMLSPTLTLSLLALVIVVRNVNWWLSQTSCKVVKVFLFLLLSRLLALHSFLKHLPVRQVTHVFSSSSPREIRFVVLMFFFLISVCDGLNSAQSSKFSRIFLATQTNKNSWSLIMHTLVLNQKEKEKHWYLLISLVWIDAYLDSCTACWFDQCLFYWLTFSGQLLGDTRAVSCFCWSWKQLPRA